MDSLFSKKVQEQARDLIALQNELMSARDYIKLCEQRILELSPGHELPVSTASLGTAPIDSKHRSSSDSSLQRELEAAQQQIQQMQAERDSYRGFVGNDSDSARAISALRQQLLEAQEESRGLLQRVRAEAASAEGTRA